MTAPRRADPAPRPPARRALGFAAIVVAVAIWAGWILLVRASIGGALSTWDVAALRYGVPALALAPVWLRRGLLPRGVGALRLAAMTLGWGAPFAMFGAQGLRSAEPAFFAAIVPGGMPLWAASIMAAALGARFALRARLGLALVAAALAAAILGAWAAGEDANLAGAPWLFAASASWAAYAVAFRGSGLSPLEATAIVAAWSTLLLAPLGFVMESRLPALSPAELATQVLLHGVVSGFVSVLAFATAVREFGAARAAGFSALVPVTAAAAAVPLLGEVPGVATAAAILAASAGVALFNTAPPPTMRAGAGD